MPFALALVQAGSETSQDQTLFIILGVITLATLVALGLRFLVNMRDVIIAPTASLGHLGQTDNFFFSLFVVFLGGLIGLFGIIPRKAELLTAFNEYASAVTKDIALANANSIYRDSAQIWGQEVLMNDFKIFGMDNAIFFPILMVVLWIVIGSICFGAAKIMGTGTSYGDFLGGLALQLVLRQHRPRLRLPVRDPVRGQHRQQDTGYPGYLGYRRYRATGLCPDPIPNGHFPGR